MPGSDANYTPLIKRRKLQNFVENHEPLQLESAEVVDLTVEEIESEPGPSESQCCDVQPPLRFFNISKQSFTNNVDAKFYEFLISKVCDLNTNVGGELRILIKNVLAQYGVKIIIKCCYFQDSVVCVNYAKCLRSLDYFVDLVNVHSWQEWYFSPAKISSVSLDVRVFFAQKVFSLLSGLRKHIYANQWDAVRQIMSEFDFNPLNYAGNNGWYPRPLLILYSFRWPQLFSVLLQWIVITKDDRDDKMKAVENLLDTFKLTLLSCVLVTRNCYPLYVSMALTVAIAEEHLPSLKNLLKVKILPKDNDPEYYFVMSNYIYLAQFLVLSLKRTSNKNYQWGNLFDNMNHSLQNAMEHHSQLLCLIEPLLTVAKLVKRENDAIETVTELCVLAPALLPFVCSIMMRIGYHSNVGGILSEVMENTSSPFLHQFPLVLHYIANRAILAQHSFHYEMVEAHVRILLDFLDQGRNRSKGKAWTTLKVHLKAMSLIPKWLREEWNDRASWWPQFHSKVNIGDYSRDRRKCLNFLKKNCVLDC